MINNEYPSGYVDEFFAKVHSHFYVDGIIGSPYFEGNVSKDFLLFVPKKEVVEEIECSKELSMKQLTKKIF